MLNDEYLFYLNYMLIYFHNNGSDKGMCTYSPVVFCVNKGFFVEICNAIEGWETR